MSEIEPVTERDIDEVLNARAAGYDIRYALEQDRRRVAERQAERHSVGSTLRHTNVARLRELSHAVTQGPDAIRRECSMRVPAEPDRDADLVLSSAADEIERLRAEVAKMHARRAVLFGELIELKRAIENGHRASAIAIIDAIARVIPDQSKTLAELRAEVAAHRKHDVLRCDALMKAEAEVAKLNAACAAKDAALRVLDVESNSTLDSVVIAAALALDGGSNYIDASGAVEATAVVFAPEHGVEVCAAVPDDWAGDTVKIVRVKP